jgi:hypothetical protein
VNRIALAVVVAVVVSIAPARAQDAAPGLTIPDHWRELPEMIRSEPTLDGISIAARKAWGDPVGGVFFIAQTIETDKTGSAAELRAALVQTLGAAELKLGAADPTADPLRIDFEAAGLSGAVMASIAKQAKGKLRVRSVACFYNQREPEISEQLCNALFSQFAATP